MASFAPETTNHAVNANPFPAPNMAEGFQDLASEKTFHNSRGSAGVQLEHFSESGDAFLWLAGNAQAVIGQWRIAAATPAKEKISYVFLYES